MPGVQHSTGIIFVNNVVEADVNLCHDAYKAVHSNTVQGFTDVAVWMISPPEANYLAFPVKLNHQYSSTARVLGWVLSETSVG